MPQIAAFHSFDVLPGALSLTGFILLAIAFRARLALGALRARLKSAEAELQKLKSEPRHLEYRIERFDVLWFPGVTINPESKTVVQVSAGVPHCKSCVAPLTLAGDQRRAGDQWNAGDQSVGNQEAVGGRAGMESQEGWRCRQCGAKYPGTLADVFVMDSITKETMKFFQERHAGYRLPTK